MSLTYPLLKPIRRLHANIRTAVAPNRGTQTSHLRPSRANNHIQQQIKLLLQHALQKRHLLSRHRKK